MSSWKVVVTAVTFAKASPEPLDRLRAAGCEVVTNPWGRPLTEAELLEAVAEADALIVGNDKVSAAVINAAPRLKIIAKHGVGYDNIDRKAAAARGILVTNAPGTNSHEVADLAFGLLHMLARGLHIAIEATKQGKWIKPMGIGLWGKTLGIVGVGRIGTAVAARARGYDMRILGFDIVIRPEALALGVRYVGLEELLQNSDFVSLHLPLTPETRNILSAEMLQLLKPGALLINTARWGLVDHDALFKLLEAGRIGGYGLDVYEVEPPEPHLLFALPNVLLTPHMGGTCRESNLRMGNTAVDNVLAVKEGRTPPNLIPADAD